MFEWLNFRAYVIIAIVTTLVWLLIQLVARSALLGIVNEFSARAIAGGLSPTIASFIAEPIRFALNVNVIGAVLVGALWPLTLFWLLLLFLLMILAFLGPGLNAGRDSIQ